MNPPAREIDLRKGPWVEAEDCTAADLPFRAWDPRSVSPGGQVTRASTDSWVRRIASRVVWGCELFSPRRCA
jgi:hypothetical protein